MKQSVFEFGLRVLGADISVCTTLLNEALIRLEGIDLIDFEGDASNLTMKVRASFANGESAKRLHRKLMTKIMSFEGIEIAYARSNLTEIFG